MREKFEHVGKGVSALKPKTVHRIYGMPYLLELLKIRYMQKKENVGVIAMFASHPIGTCPKRWLLSQG